MKPVFVDTGIWYALMDAKDPDHSGIELLLRQYQAALVTSNYVFDETLTLLRYRLGWHVAYAFGEQALTGGLARLVRITEQDEQAAWAIFSRYRDKSFSFTDCSSFALIERLNIETVLTLDSDFRTYGLYCLPYQSGA